MACVSCRLGVSFGACACRANCLVGTSVTCSSPANGWSNEAKSKPTEVWDAGCNRGTKDCAECMDHAMLEEMQKCQGSQYCLQQVRQQYNESPMLQEAVYCNMKLPTGKRSGCETFLNTPAPELGWECHAKAVDCWAVSREPGYEETIPSIMAPSVWDSVPLKRDVGDSLP